MPTEGWALHFDVWRLFLWCFGIPLLGALGEIIIQCWDNNDWPWGIDRSGIMNKNDKRNRKREKNGKTENDSRF